MSRSAEPNWNVSPEPTNFAVFSGPLNKTVPAPDDAELIEIVPTVPQVADA